MADEFYVRVYSGHTGKFGHEFLELEFRPDGKVCLCLVIDVVSTEGLIIQVKLK